MYWNLKNENFSKSNSGVNILGGDFMEMFIDLRVILGKVMRSQTSAGRKVHNGKCIHKLEMV